MNWLTSRVAEVVAQLVRLEEHTERLARWAAEVAEVAAAGGRLLIVGNGGCAALAQHLAAELVGGSLDDPSAFSALALHTDTSTLTAIANDHGFVEVFSRQVRAHGRRGDILLVLTTSGRSENLIRAAEEAMVLGIRVWAITGPQPNPVSECSEECIAVPSPSTAVIQEVQMVVAHALVERLNVMHGRELTSVRWSES